jgi:thiamine transporter ThiT
VYLLKLILNNFYVKSYVQGIIEVLSGFILVEWNGSFDKNASMVWISPR